MTLLELQAPPLPEAGVGAAPSANRGGPTEEGHESSTARLRALVDQHYDFLWRSVRYFGVPDAVAEDATQQVLCVLARRLGDISPGSEKAFLFATARRVASEVRRTARRRPVTAARDVDSLVASDPTAEELLDERRARAVLREVLEAIPVDLRVVFVLFEIEELTLVEIAHLIGIPLGTATSRLRRAREGFQVLVRRRQAVVGRESREGRP
jgi:RNA polymerase sigma-70 factor, ECF subfamily